MIRPRTAQQFNEEIFMILNGTSAYGGMRKECYTMRGLKSGKTLTQSNSLAWAMLLHDILLW